MALILVSASERQTLSFPQIKPGKLSGGKREPA